MQKSVSAARAFKDLSYATISGVPFGWQLNNCFTFLMKIDSLILMTFEPPFALRIMGDFSVEKALVMTAKTRSLRDFVHFAPGCEKSLESGTFCSFCSFS